MPTAESPQRLGPWPWYLIAAEIVGFNVDIVDDIAGDLVEQCAGTAGSTLLAQRMWCATQIARAVPYLAISTLRRGHPRERLRLLAWLTTLGLVAASIVAAVQLHIGPPARLDADRGFDRGNIVINNIKPRQMPVRALDARGHTVPGAGIRYERVSGDNVALSENGAISCRAPGDAVVRASLNDLTSLTTVHCRPVTGIQTQAWHDFLPGDPPQLVRVAVVDERGHIVKELRGSVHLTDTTVATLHRGLLTPRRLGASQLAIAIGDMRVNVRVVVHQMVDRFDNLALTQRHVAMPLRLSPGDTLHLGVPSGTVWVKWMPRDGTTAHPEITAEGSGYCHSGSEELTRWLPAGEYGAFCEMSDGARIRIARNTASDLTLTGALLLERMSR